MRLLRSLRQPADRASAAREHLPCAAGHALSLRGVRRDFAGVRALRDVSLEVAGGEFLTLLGPSGSGKTTLLNLVAGFDVPDSGRVLLDGRDVTDLPPERRGFGMVFQGYALFPQLSVAENVAFPLRVRRIGRAEREARVRAALDLVRLGPLALRLPAQLSGGQQQRAALARALVFEPAVLLLDEPLAALDQELRGKLREELRDLHRRIGRTLLNVTHDQDEALSLSDRIAVLDRGRLVQVGTPAELYEHPATRFVAGFLGAANIMSGTVKESGAGWVALHVGGLRMLVRGVARPGEAILLSLRPERIALLPPMAGSADNLAEGRLVSRSFLGGRHALAVEIAGLGVLRVSLPSWGSPPVPAEGAPVRLGWSRDAAVAVREDAA